MYLSEWGIYMKKKNLAKRKKIRIVKKTIPILILFILIGFLTVYIKYIDKKSKEMLDESYYTYTQKEEFDGEEGFKLIDIQSNLSSFLKKIKTEETSVSYKIANNSFYFDLLVKKNDDEYTFEIDRIIDDNHNMHAKMKYENVNKIEYRTGNENHATVLKLYTDNEYRYLAITGNTYYFLGSDIENISYLDGEFYYLSYNKKYASLKTAISCDKSVKNSIDGFKSSEYYYKYGKINFLTDYYQKLSSKVFTVEERCNELIENSKTEVDI